MKKILIVGAGGLGKELVDLIRAIGEYEIAGFLDDDPEKQNTMVNQVPVLGTAMQLAQYKGVKNLAIAIAKPELKRKIVQAAENAGFSFPNLIHPTVSLGSHVSLGKGNILCANTVISTEVTLHDFVTVNPQCGIGHESTLHSFSTLYWGVHIGGNVTMGEGCELGTHACVIQGLSIADDIVLGAGAVAVKNISEQGTYVGVPARKMD